MLKTLAYVFGIVFLVIGVLGFVPAAAPNNMLLGYFHVNTAHNIAALVTGVFALWAACGCACCGKYFTPKLFFQIFGVILGVLAVLGFWDGAAPVLGVIANNFADSIFHCVAAVVALYLGFVYKE